jgi:hypothetical protein
MADYTEDAQGALEDIREAGMSMVLKRSDGGTFDPATSAISGETDTETAFYGLQLNAKIDNFLFDESRRDGLISGKVKLILADAVSFSSASVVPIIGDRIAYLSKEWEIFGIKDINLDGTPIIYKFGVVQS